MSNADGYTLTHIGIQENPDRSQNLFLRFDHPERREGIWSINVDNDMSMAKVGDKLESLGQTIQGRTNLDQEGTKATSKPAEGQIPHADKQNAPQHDLSAFPVTPTDKSGQIGPTEYGMSLRDYFAVEALNALIAKTPHRSSNEEEFCPQVEANVNGAYFYADAMLKRRKRKC